MNKTALIAIPLAIATGVLMFKKRWKLFPNFEPHEFACKCGSCDESSGLNVSFSTMVRLQRLRNVCDFPFVITSGYRCINHPVEAKKVNGGGTHYLGHGFDIKATPAEQEIIEREALKLGFTGIGRGSTFIHLDDYAGDDIRPRPAKWAY